MPSPKTVTAFQFSTAQGGGNDHAAGREGREIFPQVNLAATDNLAAGSIQSQGLRAVTLIKVQQRR